VTHILLNTTWRTIEADTPKRLAMAELRSPLACSSLILAAFAAVSLNALLGLFMARLLWAECALFSTYVFHTRFVALLSVLFPFMWLTVGRKGSGVKKAIATSLCTKRISPKGARRYPLVLCGAGFIRRFVAASRRRPKSLTSYLGVPGAGFQFSIFKLSVGSGRLLYHKGVI
jgi:hypothetical protein